MKPLPEPSRRFAGMQINWLGLALLACGLFAALVASCALGSVVIPVRETLHALMSGTTSDATWTAILFELRLPRTLTAAAAGAALGVTGLYLQTLLRNPLADPYILGISSGASLAVAVVVLTTGAGTGIMGALSWLHQFGIVGAAMIGALGVTAILLTVARQVDVLTLLIGGVMFGALTGACVHVLVFVAAPDRVQAFTLWSYGTFGAVTAKQLWIFLPVVGLGLVAALTLVKPANALLLGEATAETLGVNTRWVRWSFIAIGSLLVSVVTAYCGPIAFIGVAVPHVCRGLLRTADNRTLAPACILVGATLALVADIVARLPGSGFVLPLSAVTAFIGAPVVLLVLWRARKGRLA